MKNRGIKSCAATLGLLSLAVMAGSASAAAPPLNILFYGNSFTNTVDDPGWRVNGVPGLVQAVAVGDGQTQPNVVNASVNSTDLGWHIANNTAPISTSPESGNWNYVVLQEYSTFPTDSPTWGHPSLFLSNAPALYNLVKADSPQVKPVLFETWARGPKSTDLPIFYPSSPNTAGSPPYTAAAVEMQTELHNYYYQAQGLIGPNCAVAPVGDHFESMGFDDSLYSMAGGGAGSYYHESNKGSLLAAMILYETIYNHPSLNDVSYASMNSALNNILVGTPSAGMGLSSFGVSDAASWNALVVAAAVPEPTSLAVMGLAMAVLTRRRRV